MDTFDKIPITTDDVHTTIANALGTQHKRDCEIFLQHSDTL